MRRRQVLPAAIAVVLAALVLTTGWAAMRPAAVERSPLPAPISVPGGSLPPAPPTSSDTDPALVDPTQTMPTMPATPPSLAPDDPPPGAVVRTPAPASDPAPGLRTDVVPPPPLPGEDDDDDDGADDDGDDDDGIGDDGDE